MAVSRIWKLKNLDCAECGAKVEHAVASISGVEKAQVDFLQQRMSVTASGNPDEAFWKNVENVAKETEDEMDLRVMQNGVCPYCNHEHCVCGVIEEKEGPDVMAIRIIVSVVLFGLSFIGEKWKYLSLVAYAIAGYDVIFRAVKNIFSGKFFDENFLMAVASIGALALGDYKEAAAVLLFYQVGEYCQDKAIDSSRRSIASAMDLKSDTATVVVDGKDTVVRSEEVAVGAVIKIKSGEKVPLDGIVISGSSFLDTKSLTGEPVPRRVKEGDAIISGCVNTEGTLLVKTTKAYQDSTVKQILTLVEESSSRKAKSEQFITRFARYYTPAVVFGAIALAIIPSLITGAWSVWVYRALTFLVISCPCALVISVPLAYFSGIGNLAKRGILVKGGNYLQTLSETDTIVFDKTGTLTKGVFAVTECTAFAPYTKEQVLSFAAALEGESTHPIAKAIAGNAHEKATVTDAKEIAGMGLKGVVDGHQVACGNEKLLKSLGVSMFFGESQGAGSIVHVVIDGKHAGTITVSDVVKDDVKSTMTSLHKLGIKHLVMLTGDNAKNANAVAKEVGIDIVKADLLPQDKVTSFDALRSKTGKTAYVGDGINDAPVLSLADCGLSMGSIGSDAAITASDIVVMSDDISRVADAVALSKKTARIVKENITFSLLVKAVVLVCGALGLAGIWLAVFADVGVALLAVANSLRILWAKTLVKRRAI